MSGLLFLFVVLAVYRVTRLVTIDDITHPIRDRMHGWLAELVTCPFCVGVWVSCLALIFVNVTDLADPSPAEAALLIWAVAGGQAILAALDSKLSS